MATADAQAFIADAETHILAALELLRDDVRPLLPREAPDAREVSIAITKLEDALLRLRHGSPAHLP